MPTELPVLVVGAGPTGLLLGAELARRGVGCRVIDAHAGPLHWDRATVVHPRSLEVFESLGIVEPLLAAGVPQRWARLHSAGAVLGAIELAECGSRYGYNLGLSEEVTESVLTEYLRQHGGEVVRSSKLVGLEEDGERVIASIEHPSAAGRAAEIERVAARWVIGCDGHRSATRTLAGIELTGQEVVEPWAVFDVTLAGWADSYEAIYAYLDTPPVILTALPGRRWRVYLRPSAEDSDLVADAMSTLRRYLPAIVCEDIESPTRFICRTALAERYRAGRVLLAGDAAHVCSPSQGHGMNSGLQDAFNLAWKLALVCQGRASESLVDSYEAERRPVAQRVTASGDAFEQAQDLSDRAARRARDEEMRGTFADPTARHHEVIAEAELDIDYGDSPIVMGDKHDVLGPGQRLPDTIEVRLASGEACGLHMLTNRAGHTALIIDGAAATAAELARVAVELRRECEVQNAGSVIEEVVVLSAAHEVGPAARLSAEAAAELGVCGVTLLVIRPDGHVGLRADQQHTAALAAYEALVLGCGPES